MTGDTVPFQEVSWEMALPNQIGAGCVHIWVTLLNTSVDADICNALSEAEVERANRFVFASDRGRFVRSHCFLRRVLAQYLGTAPSEIGFAYGEYGKPELAHPASELALQFNLSHCDRVAAVAVTSELTIGTDVETVRPMPEYASIARTSFAKQEYSALMALPESERCKAFFRCWTRKEAVVKALGLGFSMPLDSFAVTVTADRPARVAYFNSGLTSFRDWDLIHLEPFDDVVGAIAIPVKVTSAEGFLVG